MSYLFINILLKSIEPVVVWFININICHQFTVHVRDIDTSVNTQQSALTDYTSGVLAVTLLSGY